MTAIANTPTVTVRRKINASAQVIFDAWLNPVSLSEWMRPCSSGTSQSTVKVDPHEGGAFEIVMHVPSGPVSHTGIYQTIVPPSRLVFTWNSIHAGNHDSLVTVALIPDGETTDVVITHERLPEAAQSGHFGGWTEILDSLAEKITNLKL